MLYLERRVIYSSPGFAGWLAALYSSPSCAATHSTNQEEENTAFFCPSHSERAARPTPSGSIRFVVEVLCSCVRVCDGSAPFERDRFAERVQTICPGKPQRKAPVLVPHTGQQWSCLPAKKNGSHVRVNLERGRAFPDGHHISGATGLFVPIWIPQHGTICAASQIWVWFGFTRVALCVLCIHPNNRNKGCNPQSG